VKVIDWIGKYRRCFYLQPFLEAVCMQEPQIQADLVRDLDIGICCLEMGLSVTERRC